MAKVELKGTINFVSPIISVGSNDTKKQTVVFKVLGYVDEYGDKRGKDEMWQLDVIGKKVEELDLLNKAVVGKKAKVTCYINSSYIEAKDGKAEMYIINANLNAYELAPVTA